MMRQSNLLKIIFLIGFISVVNCQKCSNFGLRLSFGQVFHDSKSDEKITINFNTKEDCRKSYVVIISSDHQVQKIYCDQKLINITENIDIPYITYIQRCVVKEVSYNQQIKYMAYGWTGKQQDIPSPYQQELISTSLINPQDRSTQTRFITFADWGYLRAKANVYDRIDPSLVEVRKKYGNQINGAILFGDIAYDLDTNNCQNYQDFLKMSSSIAKFWPIIYISGNHQYNSINTRRLFVQSFQIYNSDINLSIGLNLGPFYLVLLDPYQIVYQKKNLRINTDIHGQLSNLLGYAKTLNKPVITGSHYPLICSGNEASCSQMKIKLKKLFDIMFNYQVSFYIGAHAHTYERTYPYYQNGTIIRSQSPYFPNKSQKYLISILEGIAGNDKSIVETYQKVENFTASYTKNETGFGILTAGVKNFHYEHYSVKGGMHMTDNFDIFYQNQATNLLSPQ